jgi:hypothetical protein
MVMAEAFFGDGALAASHRGWNQGAPLLDLASEHFGLGTQIKMITLEPVHLAGSRGES